MMREAIRVIVGFTALLSPILSQAAVSSHFNGPFGSPKVAGLLLSQAVPAYPMIGGQWTVTVAGASFTNSNTGTGVMSSPYSDTRRITGYGAVLGGTYAFNPHFGLGVFAINFSGDGKSGLAMDCPGSSCSGPGTVVYGKGELKGNVLSAFAIFDPFKDPDGFRLPIMLGFATFDLDETASVSTASGGLTARRRFNGAVPVFGLSPQFNVTRWFRVAPFFFRLPKSDSTETCSGVTGSATCAPANEEVSQDVPTLGVQVTYKPWNLGLLYTVPQTFFCDGSGSSCTKTSAFALRFQRRFGAR